MKITLPWPDKALFPNRSKGVHWGAISGIKACAMNDAWALTKEALAGFRKDMGRDFRPVGNVPLTITFHYPDARRRDLDNCFAACKSALDGVALALGVDDSLFYPVTLDRVLDGAGKVEVVL